MRHSAEKQNETSAIAPTAEPINWIIVSRQQDYSRDHEISRGASILEVENIDAIPGKGLALNYLSARTAGVYPVIELL